VQLRSGSRLKLKRSHRGSDHAPFLVCALLAILLCSSAAPSGGSPQCGARRSPRPLDRRHPDHGSELKIRVVFSEAGGVLAATIDVPQQGAAA